MFLRKMNKIAAYGREHVTTFWTHMLPICCVHIREIVVQYCQVQISWPLELPVCSYLHFFLTGAPKTLEANQGTLI